ncbi:protease HtpX [Rubritalea halochordaticola]|uniref:Protease HtpX n=1 Tax=Rubritalea halochordaticola TaxID=714537 RepID=A0ABP9V2K9_9BACT
MENAVGIFILVSLIALWALDFVATLFNLKALDPKLPEEFSEVFDEEKYAKSQEYTRVTERFGIFESIFSLALTLGFWLCGGFGWLDGLVRSWIENDILRGLAFIGILIGAHTIINIPFQIYSTFVIEEKFGFNKTTPKTFIIDQVKGLVLMAIIGAPLLALILWIFNTVALAWLWAWVAFTAFTLLLTYLAPTYLLPLFNKFEPMPDGELKDAINDMAKKCDFPLTELYVMDGSKRSTKSNAFFTGFGKNKKIALYDTLIEGHTTEGLVGILAHEIGHFKCKHIIQRMITGIIRSAVVFFLLGLVTNKDSAFARDLFSAFQVENISVYAGLIFFALLFSPIQRILGIFANITSRKHEFEADAYAANAQGTPDHLIGALKKLSADNLSNLTPHPLPVFLDYSHPPMLVRLAALKKLRA